MKKTKLDSLRPYALSLMRLIAGFAFSLHGFQKLFGFFGGLGGSGAKAQLFTLMWTAGCLESFGGILIAVGLFTRPVAFILSGQMAVAYFLRHWPQGFWPILNRGELSALYCFLFLYLSTSGPGPWSLDRLIRKK